VARATDGETTLADGRLRARDVAFINTAAKTDTIAAIEAANLDIEARGTLEQLGVDVLDAGVVAPRRPEWHLD
jgi:hypothetical protein